MKRIKMEPSLTPKSPRKVSRVRRFTKAFTVHVINFFLIVMPQHAYGNELMNALNGAMGIVSQGMNQALQQQQAAVAQAQMQSTIQQMQPKLVPSKFHPQCQVPMAVSAFPEGGCDDPIGSPEDLMKVQAFRQLSISYKDYFTKLSAENQNSPNPIGAQCVEEANKRVVAQFQDKVNAMQALIGQVRKEAQLFEQEQQKIKEEMDRLADTLYRGTDKRKDTIAQDPLAEFTPACQTFFKYEGSGAIRSSGLATYKVASEKYRNEAGTFQNNKESYIKDIKNQLSTLRTQIKKDGLGPALSGGGIKTLLSLGGKTFDYGSADTIINATLANFNRDFQVIRKDLAKVGYDVDIADMDGNFIERTKRFSKSAGDFFRKEAIADCVNGKGDTGIGLSTDQILSGLRHRRTSGSSTTLNSYKTALKNILDSDAFIEDKMAAIQRLDKKYGVGEVYLQLKGADAVSRNTTPYGLYQSQIEACKVRVSQDDTFSTNDKLRDQGGSVEERINDAERALNKAITLEQNFVAELTNNIFNRVVNCEGIQPSEEQCQAGKSSNSVMNTQSNRFCIAHASSCAQQTLGCFNEMQTLVTKKQEEMKTFGAQWNQRVSGLVAKQEFFLNQIKAQVVNDMEFVKRFVPGASYEFPADLFVEMPREIMNNDYGVALAGGGNVDALIKSLPAQLDKLKEKLVGQSNLVAKELGEYKNKLVAGIEKDKGKWEKLRNSCEANLKAFNAGQAKANEALAEQKAQTNGFCQKYNALAQNPAAGCGQAESLFEDSMNISQGLFNAGATRSMVLEYQAFCDSANNERNNGDSDRPASSEEQNFAMLRTGCEIVGEGDIFDYMGNQIMSRLPSGISTEDRDKLSSLINGSSSRDIASATNGFSTDFRDSNFFWEVVRPYLQMRASGDITIPALDACAEGTDGDRCRAVRSAAGDALNVSGGSGNICNAAGVFAAREAASQCTTTTSATPRECYEDELGKDRKVSALKEPAQLMARIRSRATASDSGNIGERMRGTPCLAQQGFNGSSGFNLNSFDASILGGQGANILSTLGR